MIPTLLAFIVVAIASWAIELPAAQPRSWRPSLAALPARLVVVAFLFALWLGLFRRPLLAAFATLTTIAILTAISVKKRRLVAEPLVFSDFALLRLIVRHPDLYYTGFLRQPPFIIGVLALLAALVAWLRLEPPLPGLPPLGGAALIVALACLGATIWHLAGRSFWGRRFLAGPLRPDVEEHVRRWGLLLTLVAYAIGWRMETSITTAPEATACREVLTGGSGPALVVVVQIESFMDPAALGHPDLTMPGWSKARAAATLSGRLRVPGDGAYTMRAEYAVLTGLSVGEQGFRAFDPYLGIRAGVPTLATRLVDRGYRTLFIHPFRAAFFDRDVAVPHLGFTHALWEPDFSGAERFGPYVSDMSVVRRILAEATREPDVPSLVYAVTMENHGPWPDGRLAGASGSRAQYLTHLARSDLAVAALVDGLSGLGRPALLCLYGDHPPILPDRAPEAEPRTDYVIVEFGITRGAGEIRDLTTAELGRTLMAKACVLSEATLPGAGTSEREA